MQVGWGGKQALAKQGRGGKKGYRLGGQWGKRRRKRFERKKEIGRDSCLLNARDPVLRNHISLSYCGYLISNLLLAYVKQNSEQVFY